MVMAPFIIMVLGGSFCSDGSVGDGNCVDGYGDAVNDFMVMIVLVTMLVTVTLLW